MQNFQDTFETRQRLFISAFSIYMTVPLNEAATKTSFPNVYTNDTACFDEYFLFHVISGKHCFSYKFIVIQRFGTTTMLLRSLKPSVLGEVRIFYRNNIIMLLIPKVQNKASTS